MAGLLPYQLFRSFILARPRAHIPSLAIRTYYQGTTPQDHTVAGPRGGPSPQRLGESQDSLWNDVLTSAAGAVESLGEPTPDTDEGIWKSHSETFRESSHTTNDVSTGRSIPVRSGNLSQAWNILHSVLRKNNVRQELRAKERFEKPGEKRRRLKSERWRRRFSEEVRKKVRLVKEIKRRGA